MRDRAEPRASDDSTRDSFRIGNATALKVKQIFTIIFIKVPIKIGRSCSSPTSLTIDTDIV